MDLPMQVLGLEDENTDPALIVLGELPPIHERNRADMTNGWQRMIEPFVERKDVSNIISNQVIKGVNEGDKIMIR